MSAEKKDPKPAPKTAAKQLDPNSELPPDADLEERFNDFWKRNAGAIFGGIALGAVAVLGVQLYRYFDQKNEEAIRAAFAAASTPAERIAFAEAHSHHQLAGLAFLQVADSRFAEGSFADAAELYDRAAAILADAAFAMRARLGQGMSLLASGQQDAGRPVLQAVALDSATLNQIRGEAAYHLAVSYWQSGDSAKASEMLGVIDQLDNAGIWAMRSEELRKRIQARAS